MFCPMMPLRVQSLFGVISRPTVCYADPLHWELPNGNPFPWFLQVECGCYIVFWYSEGGGIGFIIRDRKGKVALVVSVEEKIVENFETIEALVVFWSIQLCIHHGFTNLVIESDCLLLVEEILSLQAP